MADRNDGDGRSLRRRSPKRLRLLLWLGTAAVLTGFVVAAYVGDVFEGSELDTVDARFAVRGDEGPSEDVVLVAIDDVTFDELGVQWPFPRSLHARAIDRLREAGAKVIAYDVQFTEQTTPRQDNALIEAVGRAGNLVLGTTEVGRDGNSNVLGGDELLRELRARPANTNTEPDPGDVWRRFPYEIDGLESFGTVAAERFTGKGLSRDDFVARDDTAWIDYHGPPGTIETVSFSRLLSGDVPPETFRDKVVVIGATVPSLQDIHGTSASDEQMAGAEIQANAISTALRDFPLSRAPGWLDVLTIVALGFLAPLLSLRFGAIRATLLAGAAGVLYVLLAQTLFERGLIVSLVYPEGSLLLGAIGALGVGLVLDTFERERVRDIFSRFVPEPVVDEVLKNVDEDLRLGGERRVVTVLFSDLRGFTTFSESRPPETVIEVLNRYLTTMTDVILRHGGTLVAFMGDGIMAVFGSPIPTDDHADRAVAAACEMTGSALDDFNAWLRDQGHGDPFRMGVGLNSGAVMAGNVGSERRLEYTVIGDTTNTASRLEGMTKGKPYMILMSDSTRQLLSEERSDLRHVDAVEVRGRQARVVIWSCGGES